MIQSIVKRGLILPGGNIDQAGAYAAPLLATGGCVALTAAGANQAFSVALAGNFAYLTSITLICTATAGVAATISILDASGGNVLFKLTYTAAPALNATLTIPFQAVPRTAAQNGQFFATTTGAGVTWSIACNGYYDNAVGNA
jgi:hypothetical protein